MLSLIKNSNLELFTVQGFLSLGFEVLLIMNKQTLKLSMVVLDTLLHWSKDISVNLFNW
jgi:hypothetical protein